MAKKTFGAGLDALISSANKSTSINNKSKNITNDKKKAEVIEKPKSKNSTPKWKQLLPVNLRLEIEQKLYLDSLAFKITKNRSKSKSTSRERISANTIIRALTNLLKEKESQCNFKNIDNEEQLTKLLIESLSK